MTNYGKVLTRVAMAAPPLLLGLWVAGHLECYCIFYPSIDTRYAPNYSEAAFSLVTTGMTPSAVEQRLGVPLLAVAL